MLIYQESWQYPTDPVPETARATLTAALRVTTLKARRGAPLYPS
jgi:hypothetical protein